jgi:hypothetical protein
MLKLYQMENMVEDQMSERPRQAELHPQVRRAGVIREGWVSLQVRRLAAYLRCLPAILAQAWRRCALPPVAACDATPKAACCD